MEKFLIANRTNKSITVRRVNENLDSINIIIRKLSEYALSLLQNDTNAIMQLLRKFCSERNHQIVFQLTIKGCHKLETFSPKHELSLNNSVLIRTNFSMVVDTTLLTSTRESLQDWFLCQVVSTVEFCKVSTKCKNYEMSFTVYNTSHSYMTL